MMRPLCMVVAALGLSTAVHAAPPQADDPAATVRDLIKTKDYSLCERSKGGADGHRRWCTVAPRAEVCKAWAAHCQDLPLSADATGLVAAQAKSLQGGDVDGGGRRPHGRNGKRDDAEADAAPVMPWSRDILVGLVIALLGWLTYKIWRQWRAQPPTDDRNQPAAAAAAIDTLALDGPRTLPDVDVALDRARALAPTEPGLALAWLYAAALRHLHDGGIVRWHPALGNRAALRTLAADHPLRKPLREVIAGLEQWRFAGKPPNADQADRAVRTVAPLLRTVLAVVAAIQLTACERTGDTTVAGRALTWDLLRAQGWTLTGHRLAVRDIDAGSPTLWVDAEYATILPSMVAELRDAACRGGRVVLFASHGQSLAPLHGAVVDLATPASQVGDFGAMPSSRGPIERQIVLPLRLVVSDEASTFGVLRRELAGLVPELSQQPAPTPGDVAPPACDLQRQPQPLLWLDDQPAALRWSAPGGGSLVVVADNDLLANAAMSMPQNARALVALARDTAPLRQVALLVPQGAPPAADASEALAAAGLLPFLSQGLLILALAAWLHAARFGAARPPQADRRRAFTDHVRALGQLLRSRAATRWPSAQLCALGLDRLQRRLGPTDLPTLADRVAAAQPGANTRTVRRLLLDAEALRNDPLGADHPGDGRTAQALHDLLAELDRKLPPSPAGGAPRRTKGAP